MDHSLSNLGSLLRMRHMHLTMHLWTLLQRGVITASDCEIESSIALLVWFTLFSQSVPNVDEGMIYLKWLIMAWEAKRLDENPILPHNHQRRV